MTKILVNSGFGWTSLNMEKGTKIKIIPNDSQELDLIVGQGIYHAHADYGNNTFVQVSSEYDRTANINVGIGSYITAYARIKLH